MNKEGKITILNGNEVVVVVGHGKPFDGSQVVHSVGYKVKNKENIGENTKMVDNKIEIFTADDMEMAWGQGGVSNFRKDGVKPEQPSTKVVIGHFAKEDLPQSIFKHKGTVYLPLWSTNTQMHVVEVKGIPAEDSENIIEVK